MTKYYVFTLLMLLLGASIYEIGFVRGARSNSKQIEDPSSDMPEEVYTDQTVFTYKL